MKKRIFFVLLTLALLSPTMADAQSILDNAQISDSLPLAITVAIASVATLLVFRNASKIGGGTLHTVYRYFAFGMGLVVLGLIVELCIRWNLLLILSKSRDIFFMVGFAVMGVGANKILESAGMK